MGNCFSRSKGRPPPAPNDKENINWEMCSAEALTQNNGNSQVLQRERSVRSFYPRIASMGRVGSESKLGSGSTAKGAGGVSESKASSLFEIYRDSSSGDEDLIAADGIERLCADLCLSPDEFRVLLLAWKLNAGQMCRFTRDEFLSGCRAMHVDSLRGIQARLPEIANEVASDADLFKDLYRFTFRFGLDPGTSQRILPADMAVVLWRLVFTVREPPVLVRWLRFLECHPHVRGIPRDTWNMFLNFAESVGDDLSAYDDAEAWPSIFDDFVEFENDQANQNITTKDRDKGVIETERG